MLATGGSLIATIDLLKKRGCKRILSLNLVCAPEGIKRVEEAHPDVDIYTAAVDSHLDEHGYIIPGLGDAGDRIFGNAVAGRRRGAASDPAEGEPFPSSPVCGSRQRTGNIHFFLRSGDGVGYDVFFSVERFPARCADAFRGIRRAGAGADPDGHEHQRGLVYGRRGHVDFSDLHTRQGARFSRVVLRVHCADRSMACRLGGFPRRWAAWSWPVPSMWC